MKIEAIQTGTVAVKRNQARAAPGGARVLRTLMDRKWTEPLPILAWVIDHPEGLIVVDTGETARASEPGYFPRWHPYFKLGVRQWVAPEDEIGERLRAIRIDPAKVRWVVLTHLHTDHAGGLHHFPKAKILVARKEYEAALGFRGKLDGYLPHRWPAWFAPELVEFNDPAFGPFPASRRLTDAGDVHLVPTPGHSAGHLSVIADEGARLVVFAGDASYTQQAMLDGAIDGVAPDPKRAKLALDRMGDLARTRPTVYLPSHDPESARRLRERAAIVDAPRGQIVPERA